jgi:phage-related protein
MSTKQATKQAIDKAPASSRSLSPIGEHTDLPFRANSQVIGRLGASDVLGMQRSVGNRAVRRLLAPNPAPKSNNHDHHGNHGNHGNHVRRFAELQTPIPALDASSAGGPMAAQPGTLSGLAGAAGMAMDGARGIASGVAGAASGAAGQLSGVQAGGPLGAQPGTLSGLAGAAGGVMDGARGVASGVAGAAMSGARGIAQGVSSVAGSAASMASSWLQTKRAEVTRMLGQMAGGISQAVESPITRAIGMVRGVVTTVMAQAQGMISSISRMMQGPLEMVRQQIRTAVRSVVHAVSNVIRPIAKTLGPLVRRIIDGGGNISGGIAAQIRRTVDTMLQRITALPDRIVATTQNIIRNISSSIQNVVNRLSATFTTTAQTIAAGIRTALDGGMAVINRIASWARTLSGLVPQAIASFVRPTLDRIIESAVATAEALRARVERMVSAAEAEVRARIEAARARVNQTVQRISARARAAVRTASDRLRRGVSRTISGVRGVVGRARELIGSLIKRVTQPIKEKLTKSLVELLGPMINGAIRRASAMAEQARRLPRAIARAAPQVASTLSNAAVINAHDITRGLMRPDGDHISLGINLAGDVKKIGGASVGGTITLDLVLDYPSHEVGVFLTPAAGIGTSAGAEAGAGPSLTGVANWGSVLSFGANRRNGVRTGFQGGFLGASLGGHAQLGVKGEINNSIYVGATNPVAALEPVTRHWPGLGPEPVPNGGPGTTPLPNPNANEPVRPPAQLPPTRGGETVLSAQTIPFETGRSAVSAAGRRTIDAVLDQAAHSRALNPNATYRMATLGGASLRWRTPGRSSALAQNQQLSFERANAVSVIVEAGLARRNLTGVTTVQRQAIGSLLGRALGLSDDDNSQIFRVSSLTAYESGGRPSLNTHNGGGSGTGEGSGTGGVLNAGELGSNHAPQGTVTPNPFADAGPGGPGTGSRNTPSLREGQSDWGRDLRAQDPSDPTKTNAWSPTALPMVPDLLNRPTMGWDSGVAFGGAPEAGVGGSVGVSASYSFPMYTAAFPADAEIPIRAASGLLKIELDLASGNVPGALRDAVGLVGAFVPQEIVNEVANCVFPLPPGYTD